MAIKIFYDLETNGLLNGSRPVEIGQLALLIADGERVLRTENLYFPCVMPPDATAVNGLTTEFLSQFAGDEDKNAQLVYALFNGASVAGYNNIHFDDQVLQRWFLRHYRARLVFDSDCDVYKLQKPYTRGLKHHKLENMPEALGIDHNIIDAKTREWFGVDHAAHDARGDVVTTYLSYLRILELEQKAQQEMAGADETFSDYVDLDSMSESAQPQIPYCRFEGVCYTIDSVKKLLAPIGAIMPNMYLAQVKPKRRVGAMLQFEDMKLYRIAKEG